MKRKKNALFEVAESTNDINVTDLSATVDCANVISQNIAVDCDENSIIQKLKDEVSRLIEENSTLTEKLATYVETNDENNNCISAISVEVDKLRSQNNALQNENDSYLMKISELTFENAKLTSQLQTLSKDIADPNVQSPVQCTQSSDRQNERTSSQNTQSKKSSFVPYYNNQNRNGYNSWN